MTDNNDFKFKYEAPTTEERKEIESIRNSYLREKTPTKLQELRSLNNKVKRIPVIVALIIGVLGTLVFGLGFAMLLEWNMIFAGIIVSIVGVIPMLSAHPIYIKIMANLKEKYADEILKISEELLNYENK